MYKENLWNNLLQNTKSYIIIIYSFGLKNLHEFSGTEVFIRVSELGNSIKGSLGG